MADIKITDMPAVASIVGTEIIPVVKGGTNQRSTVDQVKTYLGVSGTNTGDQDLTVLVPKTTTVNGHALSSNVVVTTADLALGNVDNTSDANKPVSTATQTALNTKQATLVSATNIKTVNSTTLLGSGDLPVQATLVSGTNIKTVGGVTLLGSGDITVGTGTVTTVSVATANGFTGSVATATTTPVITLTTNLTGLLKGDGTAMSAVVSGTDIKTINSTSLLGSGDVAVQATLVSGTNIKTINSATLLGSTNIVLATLGSNTFTGTQSLGGNLIDQALLQRTAEVRATVAIASGVLALDLASGISNVALNAAITSITLANNISSTTVVQSHTVEFTADGTPRAITWPAGNGTSTLLFKWPGGTAPTMTSTNGKRDVFVFKAVSQYLWDAFIVGQNL